MLRMMMPRERNMMMLTVEDDDVEEDDVEEEDRSQDRETHLVRACAIECRDRHWAQNADTHFVRACAIEMRVQMSQETSEEPL